MKKLQSGGCTQEFHNRNHRVYIQRPFITNYQWQDYDLRQSYAPAVVLVSRWIHYWRFLFRKGIQFVASAGAWDVSVGGPIKKKNRRG